MPDYCGVLRVRADEAISLTQFIEGIKTLRISVEECGKLNNYRIELIYELAYLKIFAQWEAFLEETFLRYLCGYRSSIGPEKPINLFASNLAMAEKIALGKQQYMLWHNPKIVIDRAKKHFISCRHEAVLTSNFNRIECFSNIRHRIVHKQSDALKKFDNACMNLCGKRYRGSRPGTFLRDWIVYGGISKRWLHVISEELCDLSTQILPQR